MTSIQNYFETISETFAAEEHLWTPNWWYLLSEQTMNLLIQRESTASDISNFENWKHSVQRVLRMWSLFFEPWAITSFKQLQTRTGITLGHIYKWSLSPQIYENVLISSITSLSADPIPAESCLDLSLRKTISMLSIPVRSIQENVNVSGNEISQEANGSLKNQKAPTLGYTGGGQTLKTSDCPTGSTYSSISFFESGSKEEESVLGWTVPIKDLFVVVSIRLFY